MVTELLTGLPRVVIGAPGSGHGKTTVATGLMGALRAEGLAVAGFKIGPDYIDPGYHALATGRPGRNLDPHLCGADRLTSLLLHGMRTPEPADVAVIEGVMGLYDGQIGGEGFASTAHVAQLLDAPVILVLDIAHMSRTAAAVVHGMITFDPGVRVAGVIINKAGSLRHSREVVETLEGHGIDVFGALPRDAGIEAPSRHLGLVPAAERDEAEAVIQRLSARVAEHIDLRRVLAAAHRASPLPDAPWEPSDQVVAPRTGPRPVVAIAGGRAFTFRYAETDELIRAGGCEPVIFDPLTDDALPEGTAGIYLGGGFPEVHASGLAANAAMITAVETAVRAGVPTVAECAGLLYLCRTVAGEPMVGVIEADADMTPRLTLGYRTAVAEVDHVIAAVGTRVTGHEFHRTDVDLSTQEAPAWLIDGRPHGAALDPAGTGTPTVHASYLHTHWAGHPQLAQRFTDAVHTFAATAFVLPATRSASRELREGKAGGYDLDHHGDAELAEGLIDLAVNVRVPRPPGWLAEVIRNSTDELASYPEPAAARSALAAWHRVRDDQVLPTAGGAEAFTLLARARTWQRPVIVHPQFTEPEAALLAAGHRPQRLVLEASRGFVLDADRVPGEADLVIIGNPTNPTGVLHPAALIDRLRRPGRVVCVDEAFMDAVPGEPETMINSALDGLVVLRSLTKTWGLAGLRAGYVVGEAGLLADMRRQQPPWSVSTPALAVMVATATAAAHAEVAQAAIEFTRQREFLIDGLRQLHLAPLATGRAPFVLIDSRPWGCGPDELRLALRDHGFAVRRGDTFPGLDGRWVRLAVRDQDTSRALVKALSVIKEGR